jgi:thioredoxin 1
VSGQIVEVTEATFTSEVLESEKPVIVDFWAPWCGPCKMVSPILEEINAEREDLVVKKVNIDDNMETAANYGILAIPTMVLFRNGAEAARIQGAMPRKRIEAQLEPALASA